MPRLALAGFIALLMNSAYLVAAPSASLWYYANVGAHPLLGVMLALALAPRVRHRDWATRPLLASGFGTLAVSLLIGLAVAVLGATRQYAPLLQVHVATAVLGATLVAMHLWRSVTGAPRRSWAVRACLIGALSAGLAAPMIRASRDAELRRAYRIENPAGPPVSMAEASAGRANPFAPSSATTNTGGTIPGDFFLTSETCGRCHRDIYDQWNSSAHHFSSFNNQWYRRSVEYMQEVVGTEPSKLCAGCHDHAVFFNGRFDQPIKDQIDTPEAQAGLGCVSCHSIVHVGSTMGQGDFVIEFPPLHDLATSDNKKIIFDFL